MSTWRVASAFIGPLLVLVAVPWLIHSLIEPLYFSHAFALVMGAILIITGLSFLAWANVLFVAHGEGTLATWDAPKKMIVLGPYRYVRNPMQIGLITALWGFSLVFNSFPILYWSLIYWLGSHLWLVYFEEKQLVNRFGEPFERYMKDVPRWVPSEKPVEFDP